jgi:hypothetical protein
VGRENEDMQLSTSLRPLALQVVCGHIQTMGVHGVSRLTWCLTQLPAAKSCPALKDFLEAVQPMRGNLTNHVVWVAAGYRVHGCHVE